MKKEEKVKEVSMSELYKIFQEDLQKALYWFTDQNQFIGNLLQEMNFSPHMGLPTAGLVYDKKDQSFHIYANPLFFANLLHEERIAVLHHEILHFTNMHVFRFNTENMHKEDQKRTNIAADMAINQYIVGLPKGVIDVKYFKTDKGVAFPNYATAEVYYDLLKDNPDAMKNAAKEMEKDGIKMKSNSGGEFEGDGTGEGVIDEHNWGELSEEEKAQMANEVSKMIKRTMEKTSYDQSKLPKSVQDLLQEIDAFVSKINYKQILQQAIKKNASVVDRTSTWKRPNKRYGVVAQGSTTGKLPNLEMFVDTSGSISVTEMNQFLEVISGFLKVGVRNCFLSFWHTALYKTRKFKLNGKVKEDEIQSGGTDMTEVCQRINKVNPDLSIILTDGYYSTEVIPKGEVVVVISENGNKDHPLAKGHKNVKTIMLSGLQDKKKAC